MKTKFVVLAFFIISFAFVLCGAGCGNIADSSASSYNSGNSNGGAVGYIGASQAMISYYSKAATAGNDTVPGMVGSLYWSNKYDSKYQVHTLGGMYLAALRSIKMSKTYYG